MASIEKLKKHALKESKTLKTIRGGRRTSSLLSINIGHRPMNILNNGQICIDW